jgi:hypothetical protein
MPGQFLLVALPLVGVYLFVVALIGATGRYLQRRPTRPASPMPRRTFWLIVVTSAGASIMWNEVVTRTHMSVGVSLFLATTFAGACLAGRSLYDVVRGKRGKHT